MDRSAETASGHPPNATQPEARTNPPSQPSASGPWPAQPESSSAHPPTGTYPRRGTRSRIVIATALAGSLVVCGLTLAARQDALRAKDTAEVAATASGLAAASARLVSEDPALSVALAQEAVRRSPHPLPATTAALISARKALSGSTWQPVPGERRASASAVDVAFADDARLLYVATFGDDGSSRLEGWDLEADTELPSIPVGEATTARAAPESSSGASDNVADPDEGETEGRTHGGDGAPGEPTASDWDTSDWDTGDEDSAGQNAEAGLTGAQGSEAEGADSPPHEPRRPTDRVGTFVARGPAPLALSGNGSRMATIGGGALVVLNVASGESRRYSLPAVAAWNAIALAPDGDSAAAGGFLLREARGVIQAWDLDGGAPRGPSNTAATAVDCLAYSPDGRLLASAGVGKGGEGTVQVREAASGRSLRSLTGHAGAISALTFSADGRRLASGGADGTIRVWDPTSGALLVGIEPAHADQVSDLAFDPSGRVLASTGLDGRVRPWDPATGDPLPEPIVASDSPIPATGVAFSPDGATIAVVRADGRAQMWQQEPGQPLDRPLQGHAAGEALPGHEGGATAVRHLADGSGLVTTGSDPDGVRGRLSVWDASNGDLLAQARGVQPGSSVAVSADSSAVAVGGATVAGEGAVLILDSRTGEQIIEQLRGNEGAVRSTALSRDGRLVAAGSTNPDGQSMVRLWTLPGGSPLGQPILLDDPITDLAFGSGSRRLFVGTSDPLGWGGVRVLEVPTGSPGTQAGAVVDGRQAEEGADSDVLAGTDAGVQALALSGDGRLIATAGDDGLARIFATDTTQPFGPDLAEASERPLTSVAFSPDGAMLAGASQDMTLRLWDVASGELLGTMTTSSLITSLDFAPDGQSLAATSVDGSVRTWDAWSADAGCALIRDLVDEADLPEAAAGAWPSGARSRCWAQ